MILLNSDPVIESRSLGRNFWPKLSSTWENCEDSNIHGGMAEEKEVLPHLLSRSEKGAV